MTAILDRGVIARQATAPASTRAGNSQPSHAGTGPPFHIARCSAFEIMASPSIFIRAGSSTLNGWRSANMPSACQVPPRE